MHVLTLAQYFLLTSAILLFAAPISAANFQNWLESLRVEALEKGISRTVLDEALTGIRPIPRIIELDRRQPEFTLTFGQYRDRVVPQSRIKKGQIKYQENRKLLKEISLKFGVQPRFIVALWGIETDFGRVTGGFRVIPALATLAYDGRRSSYFRSELLNALQILDEGHLAPKDRFGSWAGHIGPSKFMPTWFFA